MNYIFLKLWSDGDVDIMCEICGHQSKNYTNPVNNPPVPDGARAFFGCGGCHYGASINAVRYQEYEFDFNFTVNVISLYWRPCQIIKSGCPDWFYMEDQKIRVYPRDFPQKDLIP